MNKEFYRLLAEIAPQDRIMRDEPMYRHTTFRVGGPADFFVMPQTKEEVRDILSVCK